MTSAMRKNARWGASSYAAFSGLSSAYASYGTNFAGPAAGSGSTSAISAATTAVAAPSAGNANGAPGTSERGSPNLNATGLGASLGLRSGPRGEKGKESEVAASRSRSEYGYGQNEGLGLLSSFTVLRAQLRECHGERLNLSMPRLFASFLITAAVTPRIQTSRPSHSHSFFRLSCASSSAQTQRAPSPLPRSRQCTNSSSTDSSHLTDPARNSR